MSILDYLLDLTGPDPRRVSEPYTHIEASGWGPLRRHTYSYKPVDEHRISVQARRVVANRLAAAMAAAGPVVELAVELAVEAAVEPAGVSESAGGDVPNGGHVPPDRTVRISDERVGLWIKKAPVVAGTGNTGRTDMITDLITRGRQGGRI